MRRQTGAIVLSSSRGSEYSFESDTLKNGVFTAAILRALRPAKGEDFGHSREVHELQRIIAVDVAELTGGRQNPVIDRDNLLTHITVGY